MNIERTMEFILEQQAKSAVRQARFEEWQARFEERQAKQEKEFKKSKQEFDRRIRVITTLLLQGAAEIREVAAAQKRAEARLARQDEKLDRLIAALLGRSTNGRG